MSATHKPAERFYRETPAESKPDLLTEIIDRMGVVEARLSRPSPVKLTTWEEIERFAEKAARSGMVPPSYLNKPDAIVIAVMMGSELGLAPMQAVQNIAVINSRPAIWGDALPGLCRASGLMRTMKEWSEGEGDAMVMFCETTRRDDPQIIQGSFGVADAIRAGLWGKDLYKKYPKRMLQMRARGFCLRDAYPDVLKGLVTVEEADDIEFNAADFIPARRASAVMSEKKQEAPPEERYPTLFNVPDGRAWLVNLEAVLLAVKAPRELGDIAVLEPVQSARASWPAEPVARIDAAFEKAKKRLAEASPSAILDALEIELRDACAAPDGSVVVDAILARQDVQTALDRLRGADKVRLDAMIKSALDGTKAEETSAPNGAPDDAP